MEYSLATAQDVYKAVLDGIKKESTAVLTPAAFNRLYNVDAITEWLQTKAKHGEYDQEFVDAFSNLLSRSGLLPKVENRPAFHLPSDYFRLKAVKFRIKGDVEKWVPAFRNRADTDAKKLKGQNPYRETTDDRVYYLQMGNLLLNEPENQNVIEAQIMYYKRPRPVIFSESFTGTSHPDLPKEQVKEIVDIAVRIFLERVKEERYQTVLVEDRIKQSK